VAPLAAQDAGEAAGGGLALQLALVRLDQRSHHLVVVRHGGEDAPLNQAATSVDLGIFR
jgi:hypothetical protein